MFNPCGRILRVETNGQYEAAVSLRAEGRFTVRLRGDLGPLDGSGRQAIESCAILTTTPNQLLRDVHDRMPAILIEQEYDEWLATPPTESHRLINLLVPCDAELMKRYSVSSLINYPQNDVPACAVEVPEFVSAQATLF
jgi:putative SOS response-associated peptidase YedK